MSLARSAGATAKEDVQLELASWELEEKSEILDQFFVIFVRVLSSSIARRTR